MRHAHITKTTTNRTKTTTNDCSGTMGKSKQVDIFAPSCSAVQLGRKDKPCTGVAGAFVEHQHLSVTTALKWQPVCTPPGQHITLPQTNHLFLSTLNFTFLSVNKQNTKLCFQSGLFLTLLDHVNCGHGILNLWSWNGLSRVTTTESTAKFCKNRYDLINSLQRN